MFRRFIRKTVSFFFLASVLFVPGRAEEPLNISFYHLSVDEGLSHISANDVYIDENGLVWIATRDGLNCYDGTEVKVYRRNDSRESGAFSMVIKSLTGDGNGHIFLASTSGISTFDMRTQKFEEIYKKSGTVEYHDSLFIASGNRVYCSGRVVAELPDKEWISCIAHLGTDLLIGTDGYGLYCQSGGGMKKILPDGKISCIYPSGNGDVWIGSWDRGLSRVRDGRVLQTYRHSNSGNSISSDFVRCCCEDNQGRLWIGTIGGLDCLKPESGSISHYYTDLDSPFGLRDNSVWSIRKDKQGTLWVSTYYGGVNYFNPEKEIFTRYFKANNEESGLSNPVVGSMVEDKQGNVWIATEGGLNYLDRSTGKFKWYCLDARKGPVVEHIKTVLPDADENYLWIAADMAGLYRLSKRDGRLVGWHYDPKNPESLPHNRVRDILNFGPDSLLVATHSGVCVFSKKTGRVRRLFRDSEEGRKIDVVSDIFIDATGSLWVVARGNGLFKYRFDTGKLVKYTSDTSNPRHISSKYLNTISQDRKGNIWVTTIDSGINLYNSATDSFVNYDAKQYGFASNCIYCVNESASGDLLVLTTGSGFSMFNPSTGEVRNFSKENGLPFSSAYENALLIASDGTVFVGGSTGMVSFREKDLLKQHDSTSVFITGLYVNGKEVLPGDESGILKESLHYTDRLVLQPGVSQFELSFSTTNYIPTDKVDMEYRLGGLSDEWIPVRDRKSISWTNLRPGNYTFTLRDSAGATVSMPVRLLPHFYQTTVAKVMYLLILASVLFWLIRVYKGRVRLSESLRYEQKKREDTEALNRSKLNFFTNISHDIRTPLTIIISQVESMMQKQSFTPAVWNKMLSVYNNSIQLRELTNELLEFRKQEEGQMKIKVAPHNLAFFVGEFTLLFEEYAKSRQVSLNLVKDTERLEAWYDQRQIQKVLSNLVSNALKHTNAGDSITLRVYSEGNCAAIDITDTGSGIPRKELGNIFKSFYQVSDDKSSVDGTGIGLAIVKGIVEKHHGTISVESELNKGTCFKLRLPLGYSHFSKDELNNPEEPSSESFVLREELPVEDDVSTKSFGSKILLVEDNESVRNMLASLFSPFYNVLTACDGEQGWRSICENMPDIVVSDVMMPKMSGTELCRKVKDCVETCHIPFVLLTARVSVDQNIEGLLTGADDYISKPFNNKLLLSRCNNLVNSRRILQEKFSGQPQASAKMLATNVLDKKMLDKALSIIRDNLSNSEFSVTEFSTEMGMSRTVLFSKIKAVSGQTPNDFILTIRLKEAAAMLKNKPEMSVTEISELTGFGSARYFSQKFKDVYHISPLAFRKQ